ncbi:hypothetical protein VPNG_07830 [Cytospora leucostoma]|uniref:PCI domain-containing protein n=1 Tax=Cytospora leucostoma TaxID=1230097 RepID=A0A423WEH2_9PEZI|nr:hypothetical protein VPNG_07830 [Cytospora leucostoma]
MSKDETTQAFLQEILLQISPDLQPDVLRLQDMWEQKLWHELTETLITIFNHPESAPFRLPVYNNFILQFADKINQLKLVDLALKAAQQSSDLQERLSFTQAVAEKVDPEEEKKKSKNADDEEDPNSRNAYVYATVAVAQVKLDLGKLDDARKDLSKAEGKLDVFDSVETVVHAAFYKVNADYYYLKQDFASYYRNALLYLACIDINSLGAAECRKRAYDLATAALVSSSIYNFGELLLHPVLDALNNDKDRWLRELLFTFNAGDLVKYDQLSGSISSDKLLAQHKDKLREKIYLAALTEAVFRRPPHDRAMSFATIEQETKVKPHEIEHLVMKALSLGLLRGTVDQVDEVANINWVQPKVMDFKQIDSMRLRLAEWDSSVNQLGNWIEKSGQDVWAA